MRGPFRGVFVVGTDTGVGKTAVGAGLVRALRAEGQDVGVMKPAETGCAEGPTGELLPADALRLSAAAGEPDPLELICPWRYAEPLAPGIAAQRLGETPRLGALIERFETLAQRHDFMLVEGAGGLLVPFTPTQLLPDLIAALGLPVLIVARASLGTLNHTLLTLEGARARGLSVAGVVLNTLSGTDLDPSIQDNAEVLRSHSGLPVFGPLPSVAIGDPSETLAPLLGPLARHLLELASPTPM